MMFLKAKKKGLNNRRIELLTLGLLDPRSTNTCEDIPASVVTAARSDDF